MTGNQLCAAILPHIAAAVVNRIEKAYGLNEDMAIERFYNSELYAALEEEETKVWHYSVDMLFDLYQKEVETGELVLPEY